MTSRGKFQTTQPKPPLTGTGLPPTPPQRYPRTTAKMVLAKSKKTVGLGNSLMNDRFSKGKGADMRRGNFSTGIERVNHQTGEKVCIDNAVAFV